MPTVVHVTRRGWVYSAFSCEACGHQDQGAVYLESNAGAQTGFMQDRGETADLARGTAQGKLDQAGDEMIALAPCPNCKVRDELAVRSFYAAAKPWFGASAAFSILGMAGAGFLASKGELTMGLIVMGPVLLIATVTLVIGASKRFRSLPSGVVFRSLDPRPWSVPQ